jgi:hypothetical protein
LNQSEIEYVSEKSRQMVAVYRGWDAFERERSGPEIVDFDLSSIEGSAPFGSRREILHALLELHDRLDDRSSVEEFLRTRIQGSIFYLRALMGQQLPFADYLQHTLGVAPQAFSDLEIANARRRVDERLAPFDLEMRAGYRERFEARLLMADPRAIKEGIVGSQEFWLKRLGATGIPVPERLNLAVKFTEVDAYWSNWISGSLRDGITLKINLHARKKYLRGRPLALCLHEICGHAVHMSIWRELIAQGRLDPACGLTTVHSPEMLVSEGLGQTVSELLDGEGDFPPEFELSRALDYYTLAVLHNVHLMIYQGAPIEGLLDYALDQLPFSESHVLESEIRDRGRDPLFKTYQLSYATGERTIKELIQGLTVDQKQKFFLEMYTRPMTPSQLLQLGARVRH